MIKDLQMKCLERGKKVHKKVLGSFLERDKRKGGALNEAHRTKLPENDLTTILVRAHMVLG